MDKSLMLMDPYENELYTHLWLPDTKEIKGVVQIIHGASEHILRYAHFAAYLNSKGFIVIGNDHLGHGRTANNPDYVYFADSMGFHKVYEGVRTVRDYIQEHYPNLPVIMFAHSMGSFIGRYAILYDHKRYNQAIFSGTGLFSNISVRFAMIASTILKKIKGPKSISRVFTKVSSDGAVRSMQKNGLINKKVEWLSHDREIQKKWLDDPYSGMPFTLGAQADLFHFLPEIQDRKRIRESASSTAIFFISGELDALGGYGSAAKELYNLYQRCGYSNVKYAVLNNNRHEIINEIDKEHTYKLILDFINKNL